MKAKTTELESVKVNAWDGEVRRAPILRKKNLTLVKNNTEEAEAAALKADEAATWFPKLGGADADLFTLFADGDLTLSKELKNN
ncbi:hypothetical protein JYT97_03545 [Haliea sp. AH-315-K21]|uniref:Uncharacterized protein n=1 Tax=SAR86 cluster bacterium TaxID=2030880 RepID=A0A2A5CJ42_9GAMM|nr:hypothetical protein [Haliea sp. AH-315-K21]MBN4059701.1 hypothetical protein [bacterium AH-315-I11]MBN4075228.1 hypothetical protein [Gammaproteobacteria bacterium AH-315-E17]PCJ43773.1 MAG: hypothetical protein COA71_02595 [SAR86 cluster bacterium]